MSILWRFFCIPLGMQSRNYAGFDSTSTRKICPPKNSTCPYWSSFDRSCMLVKNGLFLPLYQHVTSYCLNVRHPLCSHYQSLACAGENHDKDWEHRLERRQFIRTPCRQAFRFSEITADKMMPSLEHENTWTIDISEGGLGFVSRQLLPRETIIRFSLEGDDSIPPRKGKGRIAWTKPFEIRPLFYIGMAFTKRQQPHCLLPYHP